MLIIAVTGVTLALVLYTLGVWAPRARSGLKLWHGVVLWVGFAADTTGTVLMSLLAGGWKPTFHGWTGLAANLLMLVVAVWASVELRRIHRGDRAAESRTYRIGSRLVWVVWLVPMLSGMVLGGRV